jgi:hypothetical protein
MSVFHFVIAEQTPPAQVSAEDALVVVVVEELFDPQAVAPKINAQAASVQRARRGSFRMNLNETGARRLLRHPNGMNALRPRRTSPTAGEADKRSRPYVSTPESSGGLAIM